MSDLVAISPKIQSLVGIDDGSQISHKGSVGRKLLDSSLYDFAKLIVRNCPGPFDPKCPQFKAYFSFCLDAWHAAFRHFDVLQFTMIEYSSKRKMSLTSYTKQQVYKTLLVLWKNGKYKKNGQERKSVLNEELKSSVNEDMTISLFPDFQQKTLEDVNFE